jgi:hypothetical protein
VKIVGPYKYYIGIDSGVKTGFALYCKPQRKLWFVETLAIHQAMWKVWRWHRSAPGRIFIRVEDARQAVYGRHNDIHKAQGAGSVMRDAKVWEDFLTDIGAPFQMVRPNKTLTKKDSKTFQQVTGFMGKTNEHGRDAGLLVFGY